jgi:hypothetical protein
MDRSSAGLSRTTPDGNHTMYPANTPQPNRSHLSLESDPEHACSDALLVWQKSAKHYYRSYLMHLLWRGRERRVGANTGSNCQVNSMWDEEVTDLLHLSLFLISEEDSKRITLHRARVNLNLNLNHQQTRGDCESDSTDGGPLDGMCALSCCTEKYEQHCVIGEDGRHGKRSEWSETAMCLRTVRNIIRHSSGLNYKNTANTAALCAAYGCHREALSACRHHLSHHAGEGEAEVRAVLLKSLQMTLCRLVRGILHEQAVAHRTCRADHDREAGSATATTTAATSAHNMGSVSCEASEDVKLAVKLLWVSLVRAEGGEGADDTGDIDILPDPDCKRDDAGRIVDMVLSSIISCIISSPLCLCPSNNASMISDDRPRTSSRDRGPNGLTQIQGAANSADKGATAEDQEVCLRGYLRAVCIEDNIATDSTHGHGHGGRGLTMALLYSAPHEPSEDTHKCPAPGPCLPLLSGLKAAAAVNISRCVHTALGSVLTRKFVRALPPIFSDHLDIDYFAELDD